MPDLTRMAHARRIITEIETEMKRKGYWSTQPLPAEAYDFRQAFAIDTMTFPQWLQFVFLPRVRQILEEQGAFPAQSMVGTQAIREFDGDTNAAQLVSLLNNFDHLFNNVPPG
jgi:uncharacterized protein YqcC (DUF446 family)